MSQLSQPIGKHPLDKLQPHDDSQIVLLNDQHWSYLKKRYNMTTREFQIAKMICQGFNNEEIANTLAIKHGTVKTHIRNIYRKTWVHNKISMLLKFVKDANSVYMIKSSS